MAPRPDDSIDTILIAVFSFLAVIAATAHWAAGQRRQRLLKGGSTPQGRQRLLKGGVSRSKTTVVRRPREAAERLAATAEAERLAAEAEAKAEAERLAAEAERLAAEAEAKAKAEAERLAATAATVACPTIPLDPPPPPPRHRHPIEAEAERKFLQIRENTILRARQREQEKEEWKAGPRERRCRPPRREVDHQPRRGGRRPHPPPGTTQKGLPLPRRPRLPGDHQVYCSAGDHTWWELSRRRALLPVADQGAPRPARSQPPPRRTGAQGPA